MAVRPYKPKPLTAIAGELPKDPNFVQTWDAPADPNYRDPINYGNDRPEQQQPQQPQQQESVVDSYQLPAPNPDRPSNSPASRTYQSFDDYRSQFSAPEQTQDSYSARPYQNAYNAQLSSLNQGKELGLQQAQSDRQLALDQANKQAADQQKQLEEGYDPKLAQTKQFLSDRGILDSSEAGKKLLDLLNTQQKSVQDVQTNLTNRTKEIETAYSQRTQQVQQQTNQAIADQQDLLAQRLDALNKDRRVDDENKKKFEYQIYQDYQDSLDKIDAQDRQAKMDEYNMKQDALTYELNVAKTTGMFQGQPTYEAQQDALKASKSGGGGSGGGGYGSGASEIQSGIQQIQSLIAQGYTPEDAYALVAGNYSAAGKRALNSAFIQATTTPVQQFSPQEQLFNNTLQAAFPWSQLPDTTPKPLIQLDPTKRKTTQAKAGSGGLDIKSLVQSVMGGTK